MEIEIHQHHQASLFLATSPRPFHPPLTSALADTVVPSALLVLLALTCAFVLSLLSKFAAWRLPAAQSLALALALSRVVDAELCFLEINSSVDALFLLVRDLCQGRFSTKLAGLLSC